MKLSIGYDRTKEADKNGKIEKIKDSHTELFVDLSRRPKVGVVTTPTAPGRNTPTGR